MAGAGLRNGGPGAAVAQGTGRGVGLVWLRAVAAQGSQTIWNEDFWPSPLV